MERHMNYHATVLSEQMFHQGRVISNQMQTQDTELRGHIRRVAALDVGNVANMELQLQHSALRACQEDLVENLDTDEELLDECVTSGMLTQSDKDNILDDQDRKGQAKRLLIKVNEYGNEGPLILSEALQKSGERNQILGRQLSDALCRDDRAPSVI